MTPGCCLLLAGGPRSQDSWLQTPTNPSCGLLAEDSWLRAPGRGFLAVDGFLAMDSWHLEAIGTSWAASEASLSIWETLGAAFEGASGLPQKLFSYKTNRAPCFVILAREIIPKHITLAKQTLFTKIPLHQAKYTMPISPTKVGWEVWGWGKGKGKVRPGKREKGKGRNPF